MNSRERVRTALRHEATDRVPRDFWASASMVRKMERALGMTHEQFLDAHDIDLRYIAGPRYIGPPLTGGADIWGVPRTTVAAGTGDSAEVYQEVAASPLAAARTPEDVDRYSHWPSADWFDYREIRAQCEAVHAAGRAAVFMGDRLNRVAQLKPAMYLRGVDTILMDLAAEPALAEAVFRRIRQFYLAYLERILDAAGGQIDIVLTGDDFGSQNGLLVSRDMWLRFLRPGFEQYLRLIRQAGCLSMHHTCGSVGPIIPDLIDCGLDVLQSLQPEAAGMSLADLKPRFGGRLSFHGGISIQRTMTFGRPDDVRREVRQIAELFGAAGGYVFCTSHNIQADAPIENVLALVEAYRAST